MASLALTFCGGTLGASEALSLLLLYQESVLCQFNWDVARRNIAAGF